MQSQGQFPASAQIAARSLHFAPLLLLQPEVVMVLPFVPDPDYQHMPPAIS
jgi:hypothetical protein